MAAILLFQESEANVKESRAEKRDLELIVLCPELGRGFALGAWHS